MKKLLILLLSICCLTCRSQNYNCNYQSIMIGPNFVINDTIPIINSNDSSYMSLEPSIGFTYVPNIEWTSNSTDDSVFKIFIEGDTMTVIRNLLNYCLQEKDESDNAGAVLSMLNLNVLKKMVNNKYFTYNIREYKRVAANNKKKRVKILKDIHVITTN